MIITLKIGTLLSLSDANRFGLNVDKDTVYNEAIKPRIYVSVIDNDVLIADNLDEINNRKPLEIDEDAKRFYLRYGFISPPFTLYQGVYILAPYVGVTLSSPLTFKTYYPEPPAYAHSHDDIHLQLADDIKSSLNENQGDYQVLFSGGLDSSLLLAISHHLGKAQCALNCYMASMPQESEKAHNMCRAKNIPFKQVDVPQDMTHSARNFMTLTLEPVADKIALVIPEMLIASQSETVRPLLDGQGADSLFSGLPHDKLYDLYRHRLLRNLCKPLRGLPVWTNKNSQLGRKIYRLSKVIRCLSEADPLRMLQLSLVEDNSVVVKDGNKVEKWLREELAVINKKLGNVHLTIRYLFMFRILPAREMQKYLLAESLGYAFKLPFLEKKMIDKYFYLDPSCSIKAGVYKYPITSMAKKYWPDYLKNSRTSPFQVEGKTGELSIKAFSLSFLSSLTK